MLSYHGFVVVSLLLLITTCHCGSLAQREQVSSVELPTIGLRGPPSLTMTRATTDKNDTCHAGALCVGPGELYPLGRVPGVKWKSRFVVPPLPREFDVTEMTYYDYLNIFWRSNPKGGYMNQFVPQLMLGNALANSTNYPIYKPIWIKLDSWHVGAQYFMGLCDNETNNDCDKNWIPKAATGKLIAVKPGEVVETSFVLSSEFVWTLRIGVVDGGPNRQSVVVSDRPFMGLLVNSTSSWGESIYENIYVGSCLENYNMQGAANYPSKWQIRVKVMDAPGRDEDCWHGWHLEHEPACPWQPTSTLSNVIDKTSQRVKWKAELKQSVEMRNSTASLIDSS